MSSLAVVNTKIESGTIPYDVYIVIHPTRPFLMQSNLSVKNGISLSTEAQIGLSYAVEIGLFRLSFFRLRSPTSGSSRKTQSKTFYRCFLNRSHRPSHHQTHTHMATRPHTHTKYHTAVSYKALALAWLSLLLRLASTQRGTFLVPLASSVYHTTAAAARGLDPMLSKTAAPAVALAVLG